MGYEPTIKRLREDQKEKWINIECPLRFSKPDLDPVCIKDYCAWWLVIQKACCVQVLARGYDKSIFRKLVK